MIHKITRTDIQWHTKRADEWKTRNR